MYQYIEYMVFVVFLIYFSVVQVQLSPCSPHHFPYPTDPHFSPLILSLTFGFVHGAFIHVPQNSSPFSTHYPLPPPSGYCQFVLNFNVSGYILLACLFC